MTPSFEVPQTVLLVEDNAEIRRFVQHTLEEGGFEVLVAADGSAALQIEGQFPQAIHLLLSDVRMPGMSGPELAKRLKQLRPEMRVMLMSGCSGATLILNDGWDFIQKPFQPEALMDRVNDVLHCDVRDRAPGCVVV